MTSTTNRGTVAGILKKISNHTKYTIFDDLCKKNPQPFGWRFVFALLIFPGSRPPSIVSADELNFCVRDGERWERRRRRIKRPERVAAVDKIEDQRKPEDFIGHRNRKQVDLTKFKNLTTEAVRFCVRVTYLPGQSPAKYCRRT